MYPISRIKGSIIYNEGEQAKYLYLIRKGLVQVCKKVQIKQQTDQLDNCSELLENPTIGRKKVKGTDKN